MLLFAGAAAVVTLGIIAAAAAVVGATIAMAKYAFTQGVAARAERHRFEVLAHLHRHSRTAIADSEAMQGAVDRVADSSGAARDEVAGYATAAYRAGLRGAALEQALRGAAVRGAALGERYGRSFVFMAASAARAGRDIRSMADDAEERFGGLASRRLNDSGQLWRRFKENIAGLFRGIDWEPVLKALGRFVNLFSQSNEVGKTVGKTLSGFFNDGIRGFAGLIDSLTEWVEKSTWAALRTSNAWKYFQITIVSTIADMRDRVRAFFGSFAEFEASLPDWVKSGLDMAVGLSTGIDAGRIRAEAAGARLADSTAAAFRKRAQIRSPSRLFAGYGDDVTEGFARGVERTAPEAHAAIGDLVSIPPLELPELEGQSTTSRPAPVTISIGDIVIQSEASTAEGLLDDLRARVAEIFEGAALQIGATS
jgi:hypothetical protein